ncbi:hypothetical protein [Oceanobacillus damuensis]|uniref:hypothetical protein n=1 Tax=Oceanobacillus damuensis TaxID=937928 RepID=UPI00082F8252|nr:hypothetical protein [Oceanobacillus damuensis]
MTAIQKTLIFDGLRDQSVSNGLHRSDIEAVQEASISINRRVDSFAEAAEINHQGVNRSEQKGLVGQADDLYPYIGLYYNLIHWIFEKVMVRKNE